MYSAGKKAIKKQKELSIFISRVLRAEQERLNGDEGISVAEAKKRVKSLADLRKD